jgi:uncharacterized protein (TIGR02266 family)
VARYVEVVSPKGAAERRTSPRVDLELEVTLESDSNFYTGLTQDISTGGLFVSTHRLRKIGQHVMLKFSLPGSSVPLMVECEVRWLREAGPIHDHRAHDHPPGMGLKFLNLSPDARLAIAHFLKARDSIFYDDEP